MVKCTGKSIFKLNENFAAVCETREGFDVVGSLELVFNARSFELEIEADRKTLVEEWGEDHEIIKEYDAMAEEINTDENAMIKSLPIALQPMFRIRKNLDEIIQIADRNLEMEVSPELGWSK